VNDTIRTWGPVVLVVALLPVGFVALRGCLPPIGRDGPASHDAVGSASCAECHADVVEAWAASTHAKAEHELDAVRLAPLDEGRVTVMTAEGPRSVAPVRTLGVDPLWQYLVPMGRGRLQVTQTAWDPARKEFFDVFGDDREPGEWGHWTGGAMTWNAQCAGCHDTGVDKGLTVGPDGPTYRTRVEEYGVGCAACHGDAEGHRAAGDAPRVPDERWLDVCAACHSRRAELTGGFRPGDALLDHFRPVLVDETGAFYPDGQVREEDFEYTAFIGSRMHERGVGCVGCHDPHRGSLHREGDALCLGCHEGLGHVAHDRHDGEVSCVGCHMPVTTYMQRDPRHDHGFLVPDPGIAGVPDVCTRCHDDRDVAWAERIADDWWPSRPRARRERARAMGAARRGDPSAIPSLLEQLVEGSAAWRASAAAGLGPFVDRDEVVTALIEAARDGDARVRMAATDALAPVVGRPEVHRIVEERLDDERRAVRVAAGRALRAELSPGSASAADYERYLSFNADQPTALLDRASWDLSRGEPRAAVEVLEQAIRLDPGSPALDDQLATAFAQLGAMDRAVTALESAIAKGADDADTWYRLGLGHHGRGDVEGARRALERAVVLDPDHPRAAYNLGVLLGETGRLEEGLAVLEEAARRRPDSDEIRTAIRYYRDLRP